MPAADDLIAAFGPFRFDRERMRLTRDGADLAIGGKPLQVLDILLGAGGRVVGREELQRAVWPHAARVDTGRRLNTAMRALREALGDGAGSPRYIETIRGRGYRWIGSRLGRAAPGQRPRWVAAAVGLTALAATLLLGSAHRAEFDAAGAAEREHLLQIAAAAEANPARAARAVDVLVASRPRYRSARVLQAQLAVRQWRDDPARLEEAEEVVGAARAVLGDDPEINVLAAELALGGEWDWRRAERLYRRALARDPGHIGARNGLAWLLLNAGRDQAALAVLEPLLTRADLSEPVRAELGWFLLRLGRPDLALGLCSDDGAQHVNLLSCRHTALARRGAYAEAREAGLALMRRVGAGRDAIAAVRRADPEQGYQVFLRWRARAFLPDGSGWFQRAQTLADAGRYDDALADLERAFAAHEPSLVKLHSTPEFAPLRTSPRYQALWQAIGPA